MKLKQRVHEMPFGTQFLDDGSVRFKLWAPNAQQVDLCLQKTTLDTHQNIIPMAAKTHGWFELQTDIAKPGYLYSYQIDKKHKVPDPASRFQPNDIHAASELINPKYWHWTNQQWQGRPWNEAIIYELHVGCFSQSGTFKAVEEKIPYLQDLGITAIELMPIADFPGTRNWGYDGVYLFAPDSQYGRPEDLKSLIDTAHRHKIIVILDVVYNHFGPEGNYLHLYAPQFFNNKRHTPWGAAINFDGQNNHWVREFFIQNALYWLHEYQFDGLRLDAINEISDCSKKHILIELAERVKQNFPKQRYIHLSSEDDKNTTRYLLHDENKNPKYFAAQWNDDLHHSLHVVLTNETSGYYADYADKPLAHLTRCLLEGFSYQGEKSIYRNHQPRGESSTELPPKAFISFLQNHDQIGNRLLSERIGTVITSEQLHAALSLILLAPFPPLLFMGQEWNSNQPFNYFCDLEKRLIKKVKSGRRYFISHFVNEALLKKIPDPTAPETFLNSILDWEMTKSKNHRKWLLLHKTLLDIRTQQITPLINLITATTTNKKLSPKSTDDILWIQWLTNSRNNLELIANLTEKTKTFNTKVEKVIYSTHSNFTHKLPPWSVIWNLSSNSQ